MLENSIAIYEAIALQYQLLNDLQKIEAGVIRELTPELWEVVYTNRKYIDAPYYRNNGKGLDDNCVICNTDISIIHHIKSYTGIREYNKDHDKYNKTLQ